MVCGWMVAIAATKQGGKIVDSPRGVSSSIKMLQYALGGISLSVWMSDVALSRRVTGGKQVGFRFPAVHRRSVKYIPCGRLNSDAQAA